MALIERLMMWGRLPGETTGAVPRDRRIPVHLFFAAQNEVVAGRLTRQAIKNYLTMTVEDAAEYDALANLAPSNEAGKSIFLNSLHSVFLLAENRVPGYSTPAEVRTKLGI